MPKDSESFERLRALSVENSIGIVEKISKGIYHDFVGEKYYLLEVYKSWPGMADDAATYGAFHICEIEKDKALKTKGAQNK